MDLTERAHFYCSWPLISGISEGALENERVLPAMLKLDSLMKAVRAMITGERMGMEAFLYPHEGLWLNRRIGSLPWMFPVRAKGKYVI